ncbi:MAG: fumarylacetoacetate hydrolase family protein [Anaerolineae bacterium]
MRLTRIVSDHGESELAFYYDDEVVPVSVVQSLQRQFVYGGTPLYGPLGDNPLALLPPNWSAFRQACLLDGLATASLEADEDEDEQMAPISIPMDEVIFDTPVPMPNKVICLAGNYAEHIAEGGGKVTPKEKTFPFFFMKPPTTTIRASGTGVALPQQSAEYIDWEIELTVVIGDYLKYVSPEEAREGIAGYTVGLDMSNRRLRLNPDRLQQDRTAFHEWLCGKWHDGFAPIGPCVVAADEGFDPTNADLELTVNGDVMQKSNTSKMVFDVYELVSYASSVMTLEPGDLIMTGTPSGVGDSRNRYLRSGDVIEATIEGIGTLVAHIV